MKQGKGINAFGGIVYINLDHRTDRKENLKAELKRIGADPKKIHRIVAHYWPFNGYKGCTLSHIDALKFSKKKKWKNVLVLEDDCVFCDDPGLIENVIDSFLEKVRNWDVFFLSANLHICQLTRHEKIVRVLNAQRSHAYVVNQHYIHPLLSCFEEAYEQMRDIPLYIHSKQYSPDQQWKRLMSGSQWYMTLSKIARQDTTYSDIINTIFDKGG